MAKPISKISFNDPVPREIPTGIKFQVLFLNFYFPFGTFFFCFGMIFVVFFWGNMDFKSLLISKSEWKKTPGRIETVESTNASENKRPIFKYYYVASAPEGNFKGFSYSSETAFNQGDSTSIEYDPKDVRQSNIVGMRKSEFGWAVMFVVIFPAIGAVFMITGLRLGRKNLNLLVNGIFSTGKFVFKEATSTQINKQTVYKVTFEFKDQSGQMIRAMVKTHKPHLVQDEATEPILYLANNPQSATMVDLLPKAVRRHLEEHQF